VPPALGAMQWPALGAMQWPALGATFPLGAFRAGVEVFYPFLA